MDCFDLKQEREAHWHSLATLCRQEPFPVEAFRDSLKQLAVIDRFWTYPGRGVLLRLVHYLETSQYALLAQLVGNCAHQLQSGHYRRQIFTPFTTNLEQLDRPVLQEPEALAAGSVMPLRPYFEVLIVHPFPDEYEMLYRQQLAAFKSGGEEFIYDIVFVNSAEDALTAVLANTDIQAVVFLNHILPGTVMSCPLFARYSRPLLATTSPISLLDSVEANLSVTIRSIRPELDHYLISNERPVDLHYAVRRYFNRVLFHEHPFHDLHAAILAGVRDRYSTPFFDALQAYSHQPKSVFHALPLSRGASVSGSPWAQDILDFYGSNIFMAETSSTQGGLDSLLDPVGAIKQAHLKAAETFGADHSFFVTNGTSTSNKIVLQANLCPGDLVLVSADCHKSIPYSVMLTGAHPIFLETYPLPEQDLYGAIDLAQIKAVMLDLKRHGRLGQLKQISLTNATFDGILYHSERFMMELLAIKPDLVFHWDEAWSAFAHFHPLYHSRMAMSAVRKIRHRMQSAEYHQFYATWHAEFEANPDEAKWQETLYPNPNHVCLRVYATQSSHKTLSAFRQASMIHIADDRFNATHFLEAFRTHTSTSPNYQIIASLDIARRQMALEGMHRVREAIRLALEARRRIRESALLAACFNVLDDAALVPSCYHHPIPAEGASALAALGAAWGHSDFVVDPTRLTINISRTGIDGSSFRQLLMTRYDIQVNKTSRNTVLFLITIGSTQRSIDYLIHVLTDMASKFQHERRRQVRVPSSEQTILLPERRHFHPVFRSFNGDCCEAGDIRAAYYQGAADEHAEFLPLSANSLQEAEAGRSWVSAGFVTPYPPGFPVLVPGQIITAEILRYFQHIKVKEIHGFDFERGFRVFCEAHLASLAHSTTEPLPT